MGHLSSPEHFLRRVSANRGTQGMWAWAGQRRCMLGCGGYDACAAPSNNWKYSQSAMHCVSTRATCFAVTD